MASSVTVIAVTSIFVLYFSSLSGHFCHEKRKRIETAPPLSQEIQTLYFVQGLDNIAYAPACTVIMYIIIKYTVLHYCH